MNTSPSPHLCPACSAEIPAEAPQGLCPKCLLLGVASSVDRSGKAVSSLAGAESSTDAPLPGQARKAETGKCPMPPSIEELAPAFPQFELIEMIGRGGMGFVYKARQPKLDRFVAIKILPGHLAIDPSFRKRFEREAQILAKLQHPLIVSVYDFGEAVVPPSGEKPPDTIASQREADVSHLKTSHDVQQTAAPAVFYLVLEYVDGVNLREAMRAGRFTPEQALAIVPQICEALQFAHSKGVLHRDIKPENILLDTEGRVKIADFGIAKVLEPEIEASSKLGSLDQASESEVAVKRMTATGSVLGTPFYMAPEQLINPNSVDHRADIFSLGVVFYEMLTGELPMGRFAAPSEKSLVDQRIDEVVMRALAKERELRQQSADEMKTEVDTIVSHPRKASKPPSADTDAVAEKVSTGHMILGEHESVWLRPTFWLQLRRILWLLAVLIFVPVLMMLTIMISYFMTSSFQKIQVFQDAPEVRGYVRPQIASARNEDMSRPPIPRSMAESDASIEAGRLGLIEVVNITTGVRVEQQWIELLGTEGRVHIEPHFSMLVELPFTTNQLRWTFLNDPLKHEIGEGEVFASYPCDYIACDWSSGQDHPPILGYLLPPCVYDFRSDNKTNEWLQRADATVRAKIGTLVMKFIADTTVKSVSSPAEWQKATQEAHLRFRFVPPSISKLNVPEECLVVLTDDSRTIFTRDGGRFTKYQLESAESIHELHDCLVSTNEVGVKMLLQRAQSAILEQNWADLLACMTDDCRDEWTLEVIMIASEFESQRLEEKTAPTNSRATKALAAISQLNRTLESLSIYYQSLRIWILTNGNRQDSPTLSAAERREARIAKFRDIFANRPSTIPTMVIATVQRLDESLITFNQNGLSSENDTPSLIIDLSRVSEVRIESDTATGIWTSKNGKRNPIIMRLVVSDGKPAWKIDSLVGKSVFDGMFMPARQVSDADTPADANHVENSPHDQ